MSSAATNDTASDHDRDWSGLQRAGFAVVLFTAAATLGFAAFTGPQEPLTAIAADSVEQRTEPATRGGGLVINGCAIEPGTQCRDADLSGANLQRADLHNADLSGANLAGARLIPAGLYSANLASAKLTGADLTDADLLGAKLQGADLVRADLTGGNLGGAILYRADLTGANLHRADLTYADLHRADLTGANLERADLRGANLIAAELDGANLTGARFRRTIMPDESWCTGSAEDCSWQP